MPEKVNEMAGNTNFWCNSQCRGAGVSMGEIFRADCSNFVLIVPIVIALSGATAGEEEGNETHDSKCQCGEEEDNGCHIPGVAAGTSISRCLRWA